MSPKQTLRNKKLNDCLVAFLNDMISLRKIFCLQDLEVEIQYLNQQRAANVALETDAARAGIKISKEEEKEED